MTRPLTLEGRVTVWSALVVALSLLTCGGGGAWFLYHQAARQFDRQLEQVADQFFEQWRLHGGPAFDLRNQHELLEWLPPPGAETVVEVEQHGIVLYRSPQLEGGKLPDSASHFRFVQLPLGEMRTGARTANGVTLRLAAPARTLNELLGNIVIVFSLGLPVLAAFVILGGRWIARHTLEPVRRIADSASTINSQQLDRRVPVPEPPDEIRRLALGLNATLDRLETSFQQAQRFSADASHELRTPLTALHAGLEALLTSPALRDVDRVAVADALETTNRLAAITTSLLLLARADAGRLQLDLQPVDLVDLVNDCLDDTRIIAEFAGIAIHATLTKPAPILGEPTRLRQIVSNLLSNAVNYNRPGGYVRVTVTKHEGLWLLDIANTGPGISPEHLPHLFDRFFRAAHHAEVNGHGLGLAISRELARAHHGSLALVRSDADETVFRLALKAC